MTTAMLGLGSTPGMAAPEVTVKIDDKGAVSTVSGRVVVTGSVSCSEDIQDLFVYVYTEQIKNGKEQDAGGGKKIDCYASEPTSWTIPSEYEGDFSKGLASATVTVESKSESNLAEETIDIILQECSIIGTRGFDDLEGTWRNDVICGLRGSDYLTGDSGRDRIVGGDGSDTLYGQKGDDTLLGGPGSDWLIGGPGKDTCQANEGKGTKRSCE
jgi:Ca2+-binding RTX toxin-like protein